MISGLKRCRIGVPVLPFVGGVPGVRWFRLAVHFQTGDFPNRRREIPDDVGAERDVALESTTMAAPNSSADGTDDRSERESVA